MLQEYLARLREQADQVRDLIATQRQLATAGKAVRRSRSQTQRIPAGIMPVRVVAGGHASPFVLVSHELWS